MYKHSIFKVVFSVFLSSLISQVSATETGELANTKQNQISNELDKTKIKLTILISGSGIRLIAGGSTIDLIPKVTDYETGSYIYHLYPQPGEGKLSLEKRRDLEGKLMCLRAQINQNPTLKEDTVFILRDPDVSVFTILAVMMLCHHRDIGFTNTVLLLELPEELYQRAK
jgi:hypothetical protein